MESQNIYLDDSSYHSGQDSDYVYDSQDHYSDTGDSYDSSLIDDSALSDMLITLMSRRKYIQIIYTYYLYKIYEIF